VSFFEWVAAVLLAAGIAIELVCCVGVVIARDTPERLHYVAPGGVLGPVLVAGAIFAHESLSQAGIKAIVVACILLTVAPVLTHATGRADYKRRGRL
jgi:multisubunit Na+/H+ antiporter MnhG subunit